MVKLSTLCTQYLSEQWWLADSTKFTTKRAFEYMKKAVGDLMIDRVTYQHGEKFKGWLLKYGSSKNTINMYLRALKPVFNWAIKIKMLSDNPLNLCHQLKVTQKPIRLYEDYEFKRLLRYAPNLKWKAIILAARTTGLRRGELLNLTKDNIKNGCVFVEPKRNTNRTWEWEPKTKEIRSVPIIEQLEVMFAKLDCFYPLLSPRRYENLLRLKKVGFLNGLKRGCPDQNFRRDFVRIQREAFGRQIGDFHSLRKTYITHMADRLPHHVVAKFSGHSNVRTLVTYYTAVRSEHFIQARNAALDAIKEGCCINNTPKTKTHQLGDTGLEPVTSCV